MSNFNYFMEFRLWQAAINLLDYQVSQLRKNKHYNRLSIFYYERLGSTVTSLNCRDYFDGKVGNSLFYALNREFAAYHYLIPKPGLGLRNYIFFTYPMRALYYAVGLYLLELSQEFLSEYASTNKNVNSFYGGKLYFEGKNLVINQRTTYYKAHYKAFRKLVRRESRNSVENKVILKFDVQNYFDELAIPTLLSLLDKSIKPSVKSQMKFDPITIEQLSFFFRYISPSGWGIAQADNNIVSSFIGYLYLVFSDLYLDDFIKRATDELEAYSIIRFVDDIYISIIFKDDVSREQRESFMGNLAFSYADFLHHELGLRMRSDIAMFWLNDEDDRDRLLKTLRKISPNYYVDDEEDDEVPSQKIYSIFDELSLIKSSGVNRLLTKESPLLEEVLKEVYDERVDQMLNMKANREQIDELFQDFNFELIKISPLELIIIMLKSKSASDKFRQFMLNKQIFTTSDVNLVLLFLCQINFSDDEMLAKLRAHPNMHNIIDEFVTADLSIALPGYFALTSEKIGKLSNRSEVIEQIRLRVMNEKMRSYSVALNHLLNEIHAISKLQANSEKTDFNANDVVDFLQSRNVPNAVCIGIRNLFDRRNINQVSHPGSDSSGVSEIEYKEFHRHVGSSLEFVL